ncbi:hypothetical protein N658DRAFT_499751 [Parathielavia hyrcaniae]|uniref:Uncharacterized protein n=1 Tax=Parathielavia hyrcaniae TaxID=113614 RepID=A0AAN6PUG6_9PEZI|nr:hypothetical protein N658DRAFT_499751 [Parathielavia hyrcaniae]
MINSGARNASRRLLSADSQAHSFSNRRGVTGFLFLYQGHGSEPWIWPRRPRMRTSRICHVPDLCTEPALGPHLHKTWSHAHTLDR